jgi:hypothetical protein
MQNYDITNAVVRNRYYSGSNFGDTNDMISAPVVVQHMKLKALLDETQLIDYDLCCLWNKLFHFEGGVEMPTKLG